MFLRSDPLEESIGTKKLLFSPSAPRLFSLPPPPPPPQLHDESVTDLDVTVVAQDAIIVSSLDSFSSSLS